MGLISWIREKRGKWSPIDDFWYGPADSGTTSGIAVSEVSALKYLIVSTCVMLISGDIARLPLILYRRLKSGGKERAT